MTLNSASLLKSHLNLVMLFFDLSNFIQYILSQFTANPATLTFLLLIEFSDGFVQKKSF